MSLAGINNTTLQSSQSLDHREVSSDRKQIVMNLYESGIGEEFIAMQLDIEIPTVIKILREYNIYRGDLEEKKTG
jgi:hypothetical protein